MKTNSQKIAEYLIPQEAQFLNCSLGLIGYNEDIPTFSVKFTYETGVDEHICNDVYSLQSSIVSQSNIYMSYAHIMTLQELLSRAQINNITFII